MHRLTKLQWVQILCLVTEIVLTFKRISPFAEIMAALLVLLIFVPILMDLYQAARYTRKYGKSLALLILIIIAVLLPFRHYFVPHR